MVSLHQHNDARKRNTNNMPLKHTKSHLLYLAKRKRQFDAGVDIDITYKGIDKRHHPTGWSHLECFNLTEYPQYKFRFRMHKEGTH